MEGEGGDKRGKGWREKEEIRGGKDGGRRRRKEGERMEGGGDKRGKGWREREEIRGGKDGGRRRR